MGTGSFHALIGNSLYLFGGKKDGIFFNKLYKLEEELMNDYKVDLLITMKMNHATNESGDSEQFTEE